MDRYPDVSSPHPASLMLWAARRALLSPAAPWHSVQPHRFVLLHTVAFFLPICAKIVFLKRSAHGRSEGPSCSPACPAPRLRGQLPARTILERIPNPAGDGSPLSEEGGGGKLGSETIYVNLCSGSLCIRVGSPGREALCSCRQLVQKVAVAGGIKQKEENQQVSKTKTKPFLFICLM